MTCTTIYLNRKMFYCYFYIYNSLGRQSHSFFSCPHNEEWGKQPSCVLEKRLQHRAETAHWYHVMHIFLVISRPLFLHSSIFVLRASCPSSLFHTWETFLQEVEADVVANNSAATALERVVATPLVERTFHMKVQARKLFAHREGCEVILAKADDQLTKVFIIGNLNNTSIHR